MAKSISKTVRLACVDLTRQQCEEMLTGLGIECWDHESLYTLQRAVFDSFLAGDIHQRDIMGKDY